MNIRPNRHFRPITCEMDAKKTVAVNSGGETVAKETDMAGVCKYSCRTPSETLQWIQAIADFIKPYRFFLDSHVVNFFKDRLWEAVDKEWMDCLKDEPVENLIQIPSGVVQDHWPASLKEFVIALRSLSLPRKQADLLEEFPGLHMASLSTVLAQGMNRKKKHEVEALAAVVGQIARDVESKTIVDVGSGQGYLAQVLSFEYGLSVLAIDASSHHGNITDARAERIRKHYAAKIRKSESEDRELCVPKTVTCRVLSPETLKALSNGLLEKYGVGKKYLIGESSIGQAQEHSEDRLTPHSYMIGDSSLILAGLHACGDLSVTMLRTFLECNEVKTVISVGCCFNLLSEEAAGKDDSHCGFPLSKSVKAVGLVLGKSARDLACQSADRWRGLGQAAGLHNFELHAFRATFQMILLRYYSEVLVKSPAIGRQGKTLRRQHHQRTLESNLQCQDCPKNSSGGSSQKRSEDETRCSMSSLGCGNDGKKGVTCDDDALFHKISLTLSVKSENTNAVDSFSLFMKFCESGLARLGINESQEIDYSGIWKETQPFTEMIGPYWSLRAALGPVLETIIVLDRLLFLQESSDLVEAAVVPIFDPVLSPRNMAIIGRKI
nr:methyltransferase-like protein 25 isoform X1 [Ipomoea batatas]